MHLLCTLTINRSNFLHLLPHTAGKVAIHCCTYSHTSTGPNKRNRSSRRKSASDSRPILRLSPGISCRAPPANSLVPTMKLHPIQTVQDLARFYLPWNTERNCSPKLLPKRFQSKLNEMHQGLPRLETILSVQTALQWHSSRSQLPPIAILEDFLRGRRRSFGG